MKTFDEVFATLPDGWLSEGEARLLWDWALKTEGPILEVGCFKGRSTCLLAALGRPVTCVDPFSDFSTEDPSGEQTVQVFAANLLARGLCETVTLERKKIEDWTPTERYGFVYLDGDHTYSGTKNQILKALTTWAGVIAIHDVNNSGEGKEVKRAALELLGMWNDRVERLAVWNRGGKV